MEEASGWKKEAPDCTQATVWMEKSPSLGRSSTSQGGGSLELNKEAQVWKEEAPG